MIRFHCRGRANDLRAEIPQLSIGWLRSRIISRDNSIFGMFNAEMTAKRAF